MAKKTLTESVYELEREVLALRTELDTARDGIERVDLLDLRERLAVVEHKAADLAELRAETKRIAVVEDRVNELKRLKDEADRRFWQFVLLFAGGLVTLAINFTLTFVRK